MAQQLDDIASMEQEFASFRANLQSFQQVLDRLTVIQSRFQDLESRNQQLEGVVEAAHSVLTRITTDAAATEERIAQAQNGFAERFTTLRQDNQDQWNEFHERIVTSENNLYTAQRNLRTELGSQVNSLKGEVEQRLETLRTDWDLTNNKLVSRVDSVETNLGGALQSVAEQIAQLQSDTDQRLATVNEQYAALEALLATLDNHVRLLRNWLIGVLIIAMAALSAAVVQFFF